MSNKLSELLSDCGARRHPSSSPYERPSDQGLEWALKPPLQSLCGWRRNAQTCRSWSNDQLSSAFTAPAARLSSRTVQQNQRWSPELPYSSRTGPAQQRADDAAKSRHLTSATQVAGAKNLPAWRERTTPAASCGEGWFVCRAVRPTYPRLAIYTDWPIRYYRFLMVLA